MSKAQKRSIRFVLSFVLLLALSYSAYAAEYGGDYNATVAIPDNTANTASEDVNIGITTSEWGLVLGANTATDFSGHRLTISVDNTGGTTAANGYHGVAVSGDNAAFDAAGSIWTSGDYNYGIFVNASSADLAFDGTIVTNGGSAVGAYVSGSGSKLMLSGDVTTAGGHGAYAQSAGTISISGNVTTTGNGATGLYAFGENLKITMGGNIETKGTGTNAIGIYAANSGNVSLVGNITTAGGFGAYAQDAGTISISGDVTTTGSGARGLYAIGAGSKITMSGDIETKGTTGANATGIQVTSGGEVSPAGNITTADGYGAYAWDAGTVSISGDVTTTGNIASGLYAFGENSKITMSGDIETKRSATTANGIHAENSGDVTLVGNIKTAGGYDVYAWLAGTVSISGDVTTTGDGASGLYAYGENSKITMSGDIVTEGTASTAYGISSSSGGDVSLAGNITTADGHGVYVYSAGAASISGDVTTTGNYARGLYATGENSKITMSGDIETRGTATATVGIQADNSGDVSLAGNVKTAGGYGVYAWNAGTIGISGDVTTTGDNAYGAYADNDGTITLSGDSSITTAGSDATALYAANNGVIALTGDKTIAVNVTKTDYAIQAETNGSITGSGVYGVTGGILASGDSVIDFTWEDGSSFTGYTTASGSGAALKLDIDGANSLWTVTGSSTLTDLAVTNNAVVDYTNASTPLGTTITTRNLSGSGLFKMKTDIVAGDGDLLVANASSGSHKISVANSGSDATDGTETLTLVETGDGVADFSLTNEVSLGAWFYGLRRADANANNWELYSTGSSSPTASGAVNTFTGAYLLSYAETQTLMQRLGDLRDTPYNDGYWFRVYGGKFESNSSSFVKGFDMDYGGVQVGYDHKLDNDWKGDTYVGAFIGYGKGDLNYSTEHGNTGGSGTVDSRTMGMYGTYIAPNGFYVDAVAKYMWMKNDFDVLDTDGEHVTGDDLNTGGVGLSLELGRRFRMAKNDKGGNWYIEPQMQYSYTHQDGGYYYASNGLRIGVDSFTSSLGRLGVLVGYETAKTNFYAKASYVKEFDGDVNIVANDQDIPESFGDSWWVYGIGFTSRLNERNSIYMSLERSEGGRFEEPWRIYGGWRINF